jgi:hypothetical protein
MPRLGLFIGALYRWWNKGVVRDALPGLPAALPADDPAGEVRMGAKPSTC